MPAAATFILVVPPRSPPNFPYPPPPPIPPPVKGCLEYSIPAAAGVVKRGFWGSRSADVAAEVATDRMDRTGEGGAAPY